MALVSMFLTITISTAVLIIISVLLKNKKSKVKEICVVVYSLTIAIVTIWFLVNWQANLIEFKNLITQG